VQDIINDHYFFKTLKNPISDIILGEKSSFVILNDSSVYSFGRNIVLFIFKIRMVSWG
jgi:hypothetical protein